MHNEGAIGKALGIRPQEGDCGYVNRSSNRVIISISV